MTSSKPEYSCRTFALSGNDIAISNGRFVMAKGKDCYAVQIHTAVKTLLGEILLAPSMGIPYFDTVFNLENINGIYVWEKRVRDLIKKFPFVISIEDFIYSIREKNRLIYSITILTDDGIVVDESGGYLSDTPDDKDIPTFIQPMRGMELAIDTDEEIADATNRIESAIDIEHTDIETLEDQYVSTKKIVKSLGGDTIDEVGDVVYNNERPPFKPLSGKTLPMETDEEMHEDVKSIIEVLGGTVK